MAKKLTEQQRLAIVAKWRASGLSIPKFAETHKCNVHNLRYWVHRSQWSSEKSVERSFVKLKVSEAPTATAPNRARFTVRKGMVLEIDENFDQPFLAAAMFLVAGLTR
jgi:transposase-like protein